MIYGGKMLAGSPPGVGNCSVRETDRYSMQRKLGYKVCLVVL